MIPLIEKPCSIQSDTAKWRRSCHRHGYRPVPVLGAHVAMKAAGKRWYRGSAFDRHSVTLPVLVLNPGARHPHRLGPEGAGQLSFPVSVPIAFPRACAPAVAQAAEKAGQFLLKHSLDGRADVHPQPLLDRVEPGLMGQ
jgi:hypothetical protein